MKVHVCLRVAPVTSQVRFSSSQGAIDASEAEREICLADRCALAIAGRLGAAEVVAVSWAGQEAEGVLRQALATGAGRLQRITTPLDVRADADPLVVARGLATALAPQNPDLILCGESSSDQGRGAVGPMIAALLGMPCVTDARSVSIAGEEVEIEAWEGDRLVTHRARPPAVVTVGPDSVLPAVPSPLKLMKAFRAPIEYLEVEACRPALVVKGLATTEARRRGRETLAAATADETVRLLLSRLRERRVL